MYTEWLTLGLSVVYDDRRRCRRRQMTPSVLFIPLLITEYFMT